MQRRPLIQRLLFIVIAVTAITVFCNRNYRDKADCEKIATLGGMGFVEWYGPNWLRPLWENLGVDFGCTKLCGVVLLGGQVTDDDINHLHLQNTTSLELLCPNVSLQTAQVLPRFKRLEFLALKTPQVTDQWVAYLSDLPNLEVLALDQTSITDESISQLQRCKKLRGMNISFTNVTGSGVCELLTKLPELEKVSISPSQLDSELKHFLQQRDQGNRVRVLTEPINNYKSRPANTAFPDT